MITFLQTYGIWIFFIIMFVLMMRMHSGNGGHGMGGGCGMGGMQHDHQDQSAHQHQDGTEPKSSDEQPYAIPYTGNEYDDRSRSNQQDQSYVREFPAEHTDGSDDKPLVTKQQPREQ